MAKSYITYFDKYLSVINQFLNNVEKKDMVEKNILLTKTRGNSCVITSDRIAIKNDIFKMIV